MTSGQRRTLPVVNGMLLKLGNYAQNLEVRAKSLGPGFCGVRFSSTYFSPFEFLAPPLVWGGWLEIPFGFLGSGSVVLNYSVLCDTGAVAEVRFMQ